MFHVSLEMPRILEGFSDRKSSQCSRIAGEFWVNTRCHRAMAISRCSERWPSSASRPNWNVKRYRSLKFSSPLASSSMTGKLEQMPSRLSAFMALQPSINSFLNEHSELRRVHTQVDTKHLHAFLQDGVFMFILVAVEQLLNAQHRQPIPIQTHVPVWLPHHCRDDGGLHCDLQGLGAIRQLADGFATRGILLLFVTTASFLVVGLGSPLLVSTLTAERGRGVLTLGDTLTHVFLPGLSFLLTFSPRLNHLDASSLALRDFGEYVITGDKSSTRRTVLSLYMRVFRIARSWQAQIGVEGDTETEKKYILHEASTLFRQNQQLTDPETIKRCVEECEARIEMGKSEEMPHIPLQMHLPPLGLATQKGRKLRAQQRLRKQAKPVYLQSHDDS
ncbi:hypothetical protein F7725_014111 [Dissostichus mawsoni]|uniref:Complex 1 LYR protein domain-containing protein n=1 Tax=Dissostichus mawsoni TaxID=36200 RepID=A0A7J5YW58_DISMA|nr:hypothetical protein F7725_014111 [Dissostichus mawsoni]